MIDLPNLDLGELLYCENKKNTMSSETPPDHVKFVTTKTAALFESWINGRMRCWEVPIKQPETLNATTNAYISPNHVRFQS